MVTVGEPAVPTVSVWVVEPVVVVVVEVPVVGVCAVVVPVPAGALTVTLVPSTVDWVSVGVEPVAPEVSDCVVSAIAKPGIAIAVPIPSASARAPVRPMYLAYRGLIEFVDGTGLLKSCAACLGRVGSLAADVACIITGLLTPIGLNSGGQLQDNVDIAPG